MCVVYLSSFERCFRTVVVCIVVRLEFVSCYAMVSGFVQMFVVFLVFNVVCFLKMGGCLCIDSLYCGCDEYCDFCLIWVPIYIFWQAGHADPLDGWRCSS